MRFFGIQGGFTVLVFLLYRKFGASYSFAHWLIAKGNFYLHYPSLTSLLECQTEQKNKSKKSNKESSLITKLDFALENTRGIRLHKEKLEPSLLKTSEYFDEFTVQIDACSLTLLVAIFTQLFFLISPSSVETQLNLALFWLLGLLLNLTYRSGKFVVMFFTDALSYEWSLCLLFGVIYFLLAYVMISLPSTRDELSIREIETALFTLLDNFNVTYDNYSKDSGVVLTRLSMCTFAGLLGTVLLFPSNRVARCHTKCIQIYGRSFVSNLWYQLLFWIPLFPSLFWIPMTGREMLAQGAHAVIDVPTFYLIRKLSVLLVILLRILSCRSYIQAFLERPKDILASFQAKNSPVNALLFYTTLTQSNSYISVVAIHCSLLPCYLICFALLALFFSAFPTPTYTVLYHTSIFYAWWLCLSSLITGVAALLYQNYIESGNQGFD